MSGNCLGIVWELSGNYLGIWELSELLSENYLEIAWELSGNYLGRIWKLFVNCLGIVMEFLGIVWEVNLTRNGPSNPQLIMS